MQQQMMQETQQEDLQGVREGSQMVSLSWPHLAVLLHPLTALLTLRQQQNHQHLQQQQQQLVVAVAAGCSCSRCSL